MFIYKVIVFDNNLNTNIISFNEDLNGAIQYADEHNKKVGGYKKAFAVKCLKDKINLITFFLKKVLLSIMLETMNLTILM